MNNLLKGKSNGSSDAVENIHYSKTNDEGANNDIAVIGIGLKVANAESLDEYWEIFANQIDCIRDFPEKRKKQVENYAKIFPKTSSEVKFSKGTYLEYIDEFDYSFFKISPREAELMEPAHRILLQTIYNTFIDAGYQKETLAGKKVGVFIGYTAGSFKDNYLVNISFRYPELLKYAVTGNMPALLPSRISQILDLHGPTMIIDTACSSSLVAVHQACESIRNGSSEMAIAGGIKLHLLPMITEDLKLGIESIDDKTRTFDNDASGTGIGEGVFCVLLKPLARAEADGDYIYGIIKSSAINHDGTASGLTAPNPAAQTEVIISALEKANVQAEEIDYIETHGTATILGDPIEFQGLNHAFKKYTNKKQFCALSASKSNLGHLYESAGIAALVKALAALNYKQIPGSKNFNVPNLKIDFVNSPFYVNTYTKPWNIRNGKRRICGVSAFGLSGTNCHIILQEYIKKQTFLESQVRWKVNICCISASSKESLYRQIENYRSFISRSEDDINEIVYNMNVYRQHYKYRIAMVFTDKEDLLEKMEYCLNCKNEQNPHSFIFISRNECQGRKIDCKKVCEEWNRKLFEQKKFNEQEKNFFIMNLREIAICYVEGNKIDWDILYKGVRYKKICLPGYSFQRDHMWIEETQSIETNIPTNKTGSLNVDFENPFFYKKVQVQESLNLILSEKERSSVNKILLIHFSSNEFRALESQIRDERIPVQSVVLEPEVKNTEERFMQEFARYDFSDVSKIVLCFGRSESNKCANIEDLVKLNILAIVSLYRCVGQNCKEIQLFCLTKNGFYLEGQKEESYPEYACMAGVCKALNRGFKGLHTLCIDIDNETEISKIKEEIFAHTNKDIVFYRKNMRYVEGLQEVARVTEKKMTYRKGGVYLITGGLGGIAYEVAKELCKRAHGCTIILLGRTVLPTDLEYYQEKETEKRGKIEKIERFNDLKQVNPNIVYYACDITKYEEVFAIISQVQNEYGQINGIVHAAGIGGGIDFEHLHEDRIVEMTSAKIVGAHLLDKIIGDSTLDFFVSFSSISTVFSSIDLPDYIAANIFLEEFASWRNRKRKGLSLTIAWTTWAETGMSVKNQFTMDTMFKAISTQEGIQALFQAMDMGVNNLVIGRLNFENKILLLIKKYPIRLSDFITQKIQALEAKSDNKLDNSKFKEASYAEIEKEIYSACCKVLGYSSIDITDNFFELGADSILLGHIFKEIDAIYPNKLNITDLFSYPTVTSLAEYLSNKMNETEKTFQSFYKEETPEDEEVSEDEIAIIGIGMRLPNASNLNEYWEILSNGISVIRNIPKTRSEDIIKHLKNIGMSDEDIRFMRGGYLDKINTFDYAYFGMSPKESSLIEPSGRIFLQVCAAAIEDAGYGGDSIRGTKTGVFLGYTGNIGNAYSRLLYEASQHMFAESLPVNQVSMMASRVAYAFDLKGPSMVIDTACSSSLVALHMASEQIRRGECDMALVGGASIMMTPLAEGATIGFESSEYKTRAFSDHSSGTAIGEGVAAILIKPLREAKLDGDSIYAVIKGSAINQDGRSQGIAAPDYLAQSAAITKAWENAGVTANDISYIEAHGTGTQLGDPIEIKGIEHAFGTKTNLIQNCGIGSVKTNIGHLNEASGISGILKIILMFMHKTIPASLGFGAPNLNIDFTESPVYLVAKKMRLKSRNRKIIVGINGFGMSGTNCHVILQEPPLIKRVERDTHRFIFTASAKTETAFYNVISQYVRFIIENENIRLADFCYTANVGRTHFPYRIAICIYSREELIEKLNNVLAKRSQKALGFTVHMGHHMIVPESKTTLMPNEITSSEQKKMSIRATDILNYIKNTGNYSQVDELLDLYVAGARINWEELYEKEKNYRVHIPTYPFEDTYCWYPTIEEKNSLDMGFHFEKEWIINEEATKGEYLCENGLTVILLGKHNLFVELPDRLRTAGREVCIVSCGDTYKKIDNNVYYIGESVEDYTKLFCSLKNRKISQIIHMKSINDIKVKSEKEIYDQLDYGFFDVINLIKGMAKAKFSLKFDLVLVSNQIYSISKIESCLFPENAPFLSIGKVIEQEYPNINCFAIDIDISSDAKTLCKQILCLSKDYLYGIRNNQFYQLQSKKSDLPVYRENVIRRGEVYLVTGGTSGIGLEIANYISLQSPCTIVLMSRSGFAPRERWEELKQKKEFIYQIGIFESIICRGSTLWFEKCDVSNREVLSLCIDRIHKKFGNIRGIFHAAGVSGAGYILRKKKDAFMQVLKPKVFGTVYLDWLTQNDNLDFMMICSSAVTDSGEAGQSDYVAANAFIDAFTDYRNAQNKDTYTVNWVSWKETGMSVRHGINVDGITKALTTNDAIKALDVLLRSTPRRVMIGQYNSNMDLSIFARYSRCKISDELTKLMGEVAAEEQQFKERTFNDGNREIAKIVNGKMMFIPKSDKLASIQKQDNNVVLTGDSEGQYTNIEHIVGDIYSKILGYDEINVYDNFFELGGDSIMLSNMYDLICKKFDEVITVADLFEYTNVRNLSELIRQNLPKEKKIFTNIENGESVAQQEKIYPLSQAQMRIYYDERINKNKFAYNNPFVCDVTDFKGDISDTISFIVGRHEILRTRICVSNNRLMQRVENIPQVKIKTVFVDSVNKIDYTTYLKDFNLLEDYLFNLTVFVDEQKNKRLLFDVHHIVLDGYSSSLLQKEMLEYYMNRTIEDEVYQYREYVYFEQEFAKTEKYKNMRKYWLKRLSEYKFKYVKSERKGFKVEIIKVTLEKELSNLLYEIARNLGQTIFSIFLFTISLLVFSEQGIEDTAFLTPVLNREKPQFKKMLGTFINLIPLRNQISGNKLVKESIKEIFINLQEDLKHQSFQFNDLITCLKSNHMFYEFNMYIDFEDDSLKATDTRDLPVYLNHLKYDLDIVIKKRNDLYDVEIAYNNKMFSDDLIEVMIRKFQVAIMLLPKYITSEKNVSDLSQEINSFYNMEKSRKGENSEKQS